ncbi:MAG: hypothetical protein MUE97_07660 [Phycisphaerales bacterium]|jgi:hypothetical protein|nr:hypothetical protein [Phycisphaerales bacterium]
MLLSIMALLAILATFWTARAHTRAARSLDNARNDATAFAHARAALDTAEDRPITALSIDDPHADGIALLRRILTSLTLNPDDPAANIRLTTTDAPATSTTPASRTITLDMPISPAQLDALLAAMHTTPPPHTWTLKALEVDITPANPRHGEHAGPRVKATWAVRVMPTTLTPSPG